MASFVRQYYQVPVKVSSRKTSQILTYPFSFRYPWSGEDAVEIFNVPRRYTNLAFLSYGNQGIVVLAENMCAVKKRKVVIKKLSQPFKQVLNAQRAYRELVLMKTVQHWNIVRLLNAFTPDQSLENFTELYLVTEFAGNSLKHTICQALQLRTPNGCLFSHHLIAKMVYQILLAVKHLHDSGIYHRDLKPENFVSDDEGSVSLLDFGHARKHGYFMSFYVTTRWYRAPELVLELDYNGKIDVWSIGCIMAELITGQVCFYTARDDRNGTWKRIVEVLGSPSEQFISKLSALAALYVNSFPRCSQKSMEQIFPNSLFCEDDVYYPFYTANCARDLLSKMLKIDQDERISVDEALRHPYFQWFADSIHLSALVSVNNYDDAVDQGTWTLEDLKQQLFNEVNEFQNNHNIFQYQACFANNQ